MILRMATKLGGGGIIWLFFHLLFADAWGIAALVDTGAAIYVGVAVYLIEMRTYKHSHKDLGTVLLPLWAAALALNVVFLLGVWSSDTSTTSANVGFGLLVLLQESVGLLLCIMSILQHILSLYDTSRRRRKSHGRKHRKSDDDSEASSGKNDDSDKSSDSGSGGEKKRKHRRKHRKHRQEDADDSDSAELPYYLEVPVIAAAVTSGIGVLSDWLFVVDAIGMVNMHFTAHNPTKSLLAILYIGSFIWNWFVIAGVEKVNVKRYHEEEGKPDSVGGFSSLQTLVFNKESEKHAKKRQKALNRKNQYQSGRQQRSNQGNQGYSSNQGYNNNNYQSSDDSDNYN
ncbi:hypothetical protein MNV49_000135 [Pseudohyphozyma bogoriensis]|nr:hypothetical protein MNV49_000135 [Pseudohyphozyma bogoriensis]